MITPHLRGLADWNHLSGASSLCGACSDACPVRIDIHHHLLHNRRNAARTAPNWLEKIGHRLFVVVASRPWLFRIAGWIARHTMGLVRRLKPPWFASGSPAATCPRHQPRASVRPGDVDSRQQQVPHRPIVHSRGHDDRRACDDRQPRSPLLPRL